MSVKKILIGVLVLILVCALAIGVYDVLSGASSFNWPGFRMGQGQGMEQGQGMMGQGQGQDQGMMGQGGIMVPAEEWFTLTGQVVASGPNSLTVNTAEQGQLSFQLGRPGFANEQNVTFNQNDQVTVQAFVGPNGLTQAGQITNDNTGQTLHLRDPNGRPLWAGQGGQGQGMGQGQGGGQGMMGRGQGMHGGQGQGMGQGQGGGQGMMGRGQGMGQEGQGGGQGMMGRGQGMGQGGGQGQGPGMGQNGGQGMGQGQGGGQGQGPGMGQNGGQGQGGGGIIVSPDQWFTLTGTVVSLTQNSLTVNSSQYGELALRLGPFGFAAQQGVDFQAGDPVTVQAFEGRYGYIEAGEITNDTTGNTLHLRDPNGRPLWAGGNRNQNSGQN